MSEFLGQTVALSMTEIAAVVGALAAVIGALWASDKKTTNSRMEANEKHIGQLSTQLDECEGKHEQAHDSMLKLTAEVSELRGKQEGVNSFAKQVMEVVASKVAKP